MGEKLDKTLDTVKEIFHDVKHEYNDEINSEITDIEKNIRYDCAIRAAAMMIDCNVPAHKIMSKLVEYWDVNNSDSHEIYIAGKRKSDIRLQRKKMINQTSGQQKKKQPKTDNNNKK